MLLSQSKKIAWCVWVITSIFYAYQYILRVMPSIMLDDWMHDFHMDAAVFGQFSGVYYIGYALAHIPVGTLLDRYGPRWVMSACMLLTVLGLVPLLHSTHWLAPLIGRFLIGVGSSAAILGVFKIVRLIFTAERFTRMLSFSVMIGLLGAVYGGGPVSLMVQEWGYITVVQCFMVVGILLALMTCAIVPTMPPVYEGTLFKNMKHVFMHPRVMLLCFCSGLMVSPLEGFADVWGGAFLHQVYGFSSDLSSSLPSLIFFGMCFGAPLLNLLAEKTRHLLGTIVFSGLCMTVIFTALVFGWLNELSMSLGFSLVGICSAYQILAVYKASTYVPDYLSGLTTAVANMMIMIFGYAFHAIIGALVDYYGGAEDPQAFLYGISVIPLTLALGSLGCLYLACTDRALK